MNKTLWIDTHSASELEGLLKEYGQIETAEKIASVAPAGDGNMNVTLRVQTDGSKKRTMVVKQARPYVAKYQQISAPLNRIHYEAEFYRFIADFPNVAKQMPRMRCWAPKHHLLILDDLGVAADATSIYRAPARNYPEWLTTLMEWLANLHDVSRGLPIEESFANRELRNLNHQHIFDLPFTNPPPIDLDSMCPGLTEASRSIRTNVTLRSRSLALGEIYRAESGTCLLHGDFYPGSWLLSNQGPFVIDPEFCFVGAPEFDWGIMLAHLRISGYEQADQFVTNYIQRRATSVSKSLVCQFAAVEVLRRLLGVAQLPIDADLDRRTLLIQEATEQLLH